MKRLVLIGIIVLSLVSFAQASEFDWVLAGSMGYLSTYSSVAVLFNAHAGQHLILAGVPAQYYSTQGYCGLARYMDAKNMLAYGFSTSYLYATAPADDLYVFLCIKSSGLSGDIILVAADSSLIGISESMRTQSIEEYPLEMTDKLQDAMSRYFGE